MKHILFGVTWRKLLLAVLLSAASAVTGSAQELQRINPDGMTQPTTYSHVVRAGNQLFLAGQVAVDGDGNLVGPGNMRAQVRQVLQNMSAVLASQGADFSDVAKITIFTVDIEAFRGSAEVREEFFGGHPPASTLVQVVRLARPEFLVEIEAVAILQR
jgi:2-iminobutanoate/2-iminopropanoate deaminase